MVVSIVGETMVVSDPEFMSKELSGKKVLDTKFSPKLNAFEVNVDGKWMVAPRFSVTQP